MGKPLLSNRFADLATAVAAPPTQLQQVERYSAILQLWLLGHTMKDIARWSRLPLTTIARIIGDRTRTQTLDQAAQASKDCDLLDIIRKGKWSA